MTIAEIRFVDGRGIRHLRLWMAHLKALALRLLRASLQAAVMMYLVNVLCLPSGEFISIAHLLRGLLVGLVDDAVLFIDQIWVHSSARCGSRALAIVWSVCLTTFADW